MHGRGVSVIELAQVARLNDVLCATGDWRLRAPTVVALGAQSSGKSSVLEALVGRGDFLPRGTGEARARARGWLQGAFARSPFCAAEARVLPASSAPRRLRCNAFSHLPPARLRPGLVTRGPLELLLRGGLLRHAVVGLLGMLVGQGLVRLTGWRVRTGYARLDDMAMAVIGASLVVLLARFIA
jgi:uncharacterized membrane protein YeaQ/YmgE (transglycosylase-associated protein family)